MPMKIGPMDAKYSAGWIDSRLTSADVKAAGMGAKVVRAAGPRTRDVVQVARKCFDLTHAGGNATSDDVAEVFREIVEEEFDFLFLH